MSFVQDDATLLLSLVTFVFWQMSSRSSSSGQSGQNRKWYDRNRKKVTGGIVPGIVFPFIWTLLYSLIVASFYIYIKEFQDTRFYVTIVVLFIVNVMLNKLWSVFFFDNEDTKSSLATAVLMFLSGTAIVILQGMDDAYVSMGLFLPYVGWVGFAVFLNYQWNQKELPTVTDGSVRAKEQLPMVAATGSHNIYQTAPIRHRKQPIINNNNNNNNTSYACNAQSIIPSVGSQNQRQQHPVGGQFRPVVNNTQMAHHGARVPVFRTANNQQNTGMVHDSRLQLNG